MVHFAVIRFDGASGACQNMGGRTAIQMGGVLLRFPSARLRSYEGTAMQMGGVLPYKLEVYRNTFFETSRDLGPFGVCGALLT